MDEESSSKHLSTHDDSTLSASRPTFASNPDTTCGNSTGMTTTHTDVFASNGGALNITAIPDPSSPIQPPSIAGDIAHDLVDPTDEAETRDFLRRIFSPGIPLISLNGRPIPIRSWLNDPQGVLTDGLGILEQHYRDEPNLSPAELEEDLRAMGIIRTTDSVLTEANATPQELEAVQGLLKLATDPNGARVGQVDDGHTGFDREDGEVIGENEDPKDEDDAESPAKAGQGG